MKPVISPELQRWALRALGAALTALAGTSMLGPGHVDFATLPLELQDSVRPPELPK